MTDKLAIIQNQFGLKIKEVDPLVYKVLNTEKYIILDELQEKLQECIMFVSDLEDVKDTKSECMVSMCRVLYIILDYDNSELLCRYNEEVRKESKKFYVMPYKYNPDMQDSVVTLLGDDEILWACQS